MIALSAFLCTFRVDFDIFPDENENERDPNGIFEPMEPLAELEGILSFIFIVAFPSRLHTVQH